MKPLLSFDRNRPVNSFQMTQRTYFENLDALRFIAFLFIFLGHALDTDSEVVRASGVYGWVRDHVYMFGKTGFSFAFVLSSYLNTWVILEERQHAGHFRPWLYYIRRALRIWPLYFLVLFIGFVLIPGISEWSGRPYQEVGSLWYFILFVGNFFLIEHGWTHSPIISVLWSVSVEEQFYLFWPFLLIIFRSREKWLFALLLAVFAFTTWNLYGTDVNLWFHTLFLLADIAIGAMFAFLSFYRGRTFKILKDLSREAILAVYVVFVLSFAFYHEVFESDLLLGALNLMWEKLFFAFILAFFIFEQNFSERSFFKFGRIRVLSYLGMISYGLFCFHEIGLLIGQHVLTYFSMEHDVRSFLLLKPLIALIVIVPLAHVSWNYFEKPFLRLKRHFYTEPQ